MKRLLFAALLLSGCATDTTAEKPPPPRYIEWFVPATDFGNCDIRLVRVRDCDYVFVRGTYEGGNCIIHAADCRNPIHHPERKAEAQ